MDGLKGKRNEKSKEATNHEKEWNDWMIIMQNKLRLILP